MCNLQLNYLFRYLERFTNLYTKLFCILLLWTAVGHFNPALSAAFLMASCLLQASQLLYRVFIKYCVFPQNGVIFLNSASSATALVFYLPLVCTHTDTEGKQRKFRVRKIFKIFGKKHNI